MSVTVLGLFGVCLAAALAELLLPGEEGGTKATLRVITALAVLLLISRPVLPYLGKSTDFPLESLLGEVEAPTAQYTEIFHQAVQAGSEKELTSALLRILKEEYGIDESDAYVKVYFKEAGEISRVEIYLSGKALLVDPDKIARDISARLDCETEVR